MSYRGALNLRNAVTVSRLTSTGDGFGGISTTTSTVTLALAAIWGAGASTPYLSDQIMAVSSHVLACLPSDDVTYKDTVSYAGVDYTVSGQPEDVMFRGEIQVVPLKRVNQ